VLSLTQKVVFSCSLKVSTVDVKQLILTDFKLNMDVFVHAVFNKR